MVPNLRYDIAPSIATTEHVKLVVDRAFERIEKRIRLESESAIEWVAGMMVVQALAILGGTVGLLKLLL